MFERRSVGILIGALAWLFTSVAPAQDEPQPPSASPAAQEPASPMELDVSLLLEVDKILPQSVQSTVWTMSTLPGRRLVALPVKLLSVDKNTTLDKPPFWLRGGGRFLCWHVPPEDQGQRGMGPDPGPGGMSGHMGFEAEMMMGRPRNGAPPYAARQTPWTNTPPPLNRSPAGGIEGPMANPAQSTQSAVPDNAPRLARTITLTADGHVRWELDRVLAQMPGVSADQGTNSLYALKVRPDLLRQLEPKRSGEVTPRGPVPPGSSGRHFPGNFDRTARTPPPRPSGSGGSNTATNAAQRRAAEEQYRQQVNEFRELRKQVVDLPDTFTQPAPSHVWAIFETSSSMDELSFSGPAPLPWRISINDLQLLANMAKTNSDQGPLDAQTNTSVFQLTQMAGDHQPLTLRLIATVLARSKLIGRSVQGDGLYQLINNLLASSDTETRRITLEGLVAVDPPTPTTTQLLNSTVANLPPQLQLISLRGLLYGNPTDPTELAKMVDVIRSMLQDPDGADAGQVLRQVVEQVDSAPEVVTIFAGAIDFSTLPPQRLDEAITYIVSSAGTQPLSAAWLDRGLLDCIDTRVCQRTLQIISHADLGSTFGGRLAQWLQRLAFNARAVDVSVPSVHLMTPIALTSPRHALLSLLQSSNPQVSDLAWSTLLAFTASPVPQQQGLLRSPHSSYDGPIIPPHSIKANSNSNANLDVSGEVIDRIMRAALSLPRTPSTLAPFLAQQVYSTQATSALVKLAIEGDKSASGQAVRSLLGSNRKIDAALAELSIDDRAKFTQRIYEAIKGHATRVVNLMRQQEGTVMQWFAQRLAVGDLPQPSDWASSVRDEATLLRLIGDADSELAGGAVAALVYAAGGDDASADQHIQKFASLSDRSESGITAAWGAACQEIFTRRLAEAAGTYSLILNIYPPGTPLAGAAINHRPNPRGAAPMPGGRFGYPDEIFHTSFMPPPSTTATGAVLTPTKVLRLATVDLMADGSAVRFRHATVALSVPTDTFAIRINSAGELKNFPVEELESLDLESIPQPIDLLPQSDGSWKGHGVMRDGQIVEVLLKPSDEP